MAYEVRKTAVFNAWLESLTDAAAQDAIVDRMARVRSGSLGDRRSLGDRVSELRVDVGQGYRLYHTIRGPTVIVLLCGGSKKRQRADIGKAQSMAKALGRTRKAIGAGGVRDRQAAYAAPGAGDDEFHFTEEELRISPFDAADYLQRESSQIYILRNALESGHADYIAVALDAVARARARRETGGSPSRKGKPTLKTLTTVLKALGLRLEVVVAFEIMRALSHGQVSEDSHSLQMTYFPDRRRRH